MITAYKIFDVHHGALKETPKTLFHGVQGSRRLPVNKWIKAELKQVTDGSSQRSYLSGFHAYRSKEAVTKWLHGARNLSNRVVCKVQLELVWEKPGAVRETLLAEQMKITAQAWAKRKNAKTFMLGR